jgi:hypothetical protein
VYDVDVADVGVVAVHYQKSRILFGRFDKRDEVMEPLSKKAQLKPA